MKEKLEELGRKLLKNIDRVAVVLFVLLLVVAGFAYWKEISASPPEDPERTRREWTIRIPEDPSAAEDAPPSPYEQIQDNLVEVQPDISEDEQLGRLVTINMFNAQSVREESERAAEIERDYARAEQLLGESNYDEALRVVESILRRNPNHRRTLELRARIEAAAAPATDATPPAGQEGTQ